MRVLHVSHTSQISGGEHSLMGLLRGLKGAGVQCALATPPGRLFDTVRTSGIPVRSIQGTDGSLALHPLRTSRAVGELVRAAIEVRRHARRLKADIIHANSIRAGIVAVLARSLGGPPVVVSVRDVLPPTGTASLIERLIGHGAALVVANSDYTARHFVRVAPESYVRVIYPPVDLTHFAPSQISMTAARARLEFPLDVPMLAVIAQITPWKGQSDAIELLAQVRERHQNAHLAIIGDVQFAAASTRFDNAAYKSQLQKRAKELHLEKCVMWLGERDDIPAILSAVDVVLAPSWEEPFGRSIVEAMAMGKPVLATNVGGPPEIIEDGRDGILLPPKNPAKWAAEVSALLSDRENLARIGGGARKAIDRRFNLANHVHQTVASYEEVLDADGDR